MWYFAWVLGLGFAVLLSLVHVMGFEVEAEQDRATGSDGGINVRKASLAE
jgi:cyd operon protein YbgT